MKNRNIAFKLFMIPTGLTVPFNFTLLTSCKQISFKAPILKINGDISKISKTNEVPVSIHFSNPDGLGGALEKDFSCDSTIKLQGATSVFKKLPKQNFSAKLYDEDGKKLKIKIKDGWDKTHKFVWKANYRDILSCHNIVASRLWGDVVHQFSGVVPDLESLAFGGAIDGFPVATYLNNKFWGLYTWNLKKSDDLFGMTGEGQQAILNVDKRDEKYHPSWFFQKTIDNFDDDCWEAEFATDGFDSIGSFNNLISAVINAQDKTTFKTGIENYSNFEHLLHYYIFASVSTSWDNVGNNILWVTYDGTKWYPSYYDGDYTFGFCFDGMLKPNYNFDKQASKNLLFKKLVQFCSDDIKTEYWILRNGSLSNDNILGRFREYMNAVDSHLLAADWARWGTRYSWWNNWKALKKFIPARMAWLDEHYK